MQNDLMSTIEKLLCKESEPYWSGWTVKQITNMIRNNFDTIKELYESEAIHS